MIKLHTYHRPCLIGYAGWNGEECDLNWGDGTGGRGTGGGGVFKDELSQRSFAIPSDGNGDVAWELL